MKKIFLLFVVFALQLNYSNSYAQTVGANTSAVETLPDDIHKTITKQSTEADINNLKAELQANGIKLTILSLERKSNGLIKSISIRVSSADGMVTYDSPDFSELVIERNATVKIAVSGADSKKQK